MKLIGLLLLVMSVLACKKSADGDAGSVVTGSATTGSSSANFTGSAATRPATGSAKDTSGTTGSGSAAAFDDKLELPKQPTRAKDEQSRVDAAADALRAALTGVKKSTDSAAACKLFDPLGTVMMKLQQISAPKGVDAQLFSSQRDALSQLFDGASNFCDNPATVGVDTLQALMGDVRKQFVALIGLGAK